MTDFLFRSGVAIPATAKVVQDDKGRPAIWRQEPCSRCGGAGGHVKWQETGWTCYRCNGGRLEQPRLVRVYTREQVDKMDATRAKRDATKRAKLDADATARRDAFEAANVEVLAYLRANAEGDRFLTSILEQADARAELSDGQVQAVWAAKARKEERAAQRAADDAIRAASRYIGQPGERLALKLTFERMIEFSRPAFGRFAHERAAVTTFRDADGNAVVHIGAWSSIAWTLEGLLNLESRETNSDKVIWSPKEGESATVAFRATVKEHRAYGGEQQTIVQRVAKLEVAK